MPLKARPLSKVSVFLARGETPPDEALVRASLDLDALGGALAEAEDFERATGIAETPELALWTFHVELGGVVFRCSGVPSPGRAVADWHWEQPRWAPGEKQEAQASRHAIAVEGRLEDPPLRSLADQLALALALGGDEAPALFDESSLRLVGATAARELLASKAGLGERELASLHAVADAQGERGWIHTHGLARAGIPELDTLLVSKADEEVVGEALDAVASLFLEHGVPATGKPFPIGSGIEAVLLELETALGRIPADAPGGGAARDEVHRVPPRLVLAPAAARGGGSVAFEGLAARAEALYRSQAATERLAILSRERWGELVRLFHEHRDEPGWVFLVKLAYEPDRSTGPKAELAREHLWFRVKSIEDDRVGAVLESSPLDIARLKKGDIAKHDRERLTEWLVVSPRGRIRPDSRL